MPSRVEQIPELKTLQDKFSHRKQAFSQLVQHQLTEIEKLQCCPERISLGWSWTEVKAVCVKGAAIVAIIMLSFTFISNYFSKTLMRQSNTQCTLVDQNMERAALKSYDLLVHSSKEDAEFFELWQIRCSPSNCRIAIADHQALITSSLDRPLWFVVRILSWLWRQLVSTIFEPLGLTLPVHEAPSAEDEDSMSKNLLRDTPMQEIHFNTSQKARYTYTSNLTLRGLSNCITFHPPEEEIDACGIASLMYPNLFLLFCTLTSLLL